MNTKSVIAALLAVSLSMGNYALADKGGRDEGDRDNDHSQRGDHGGDRGDGGHEDHGDRHDAKRRSHGHGDHHDNGNHYAYGHDKERKGRGAGPNHDFYRGQRLSSEYRHRYYVVDDWRGYNLSAPPRGSHWVQTGGDYVLVAIATGIILQVVLSN